MRKKAERNQISIKEKLREVKLSMAQDMTKVYHEGDSRICDIKLNPNPKEYCSLNFAENYVKFEECNDEENFCYMCCENEFGDLKREKREECINQKCVPKNQDQNSNQNPNTGQWQWLENTN